MTVPEPPEAPRLRFEHRLQVRRIWLDRLLIGALLVVAGLVANVVLEGDKADRSASRFFLDKRCEAAPFDAAAIRSLRLALGKLTRKLDSSPRRPPGLSLG